MLLSRREMVLALGGGFGALGLAPLLAGSPGAFAPGSPRLHHAPRAKRVIHLFMNGGPFGPDLFDPKPAINQHAGKRPDAVNLRTERQTAGLMPVPFKFRPCGQSGLEISELLPHLSRCADDLCVIRSLHTDNPNHGPALFLMNNGSIAPTKPSMGSWFVDGPGTEAPNLPGYV